MEDFNVYEGIMDGLREAVAYKQGDNSNSKASVRATKLFTIKDGQKPTEQQLEEARAAAKREIQ